MSVKLNNAEKLADVSLATIAAEIRAELASQARDIAAEFRDQIRVEIVSRVAAIERNAMASLKKAEAGSLAARVDKIEDELKDTTRLVTSLANRALHDCRPRAASLGTVASKESQSKAEPSMIEAIETAIQGVLKDSSNMQFVGKDDCKQADAALDASSTRSASDAIHTSLELPVTPSSVEENKGPQINLFSEDLLLQLQGLADTIGHTFRSQLSKPAERRITPSSDAEAGIEGLANSIDSILKRERSYSPGGRTTPAWAKGRSTCNVPSPRSLHGATSPSDAQPWINSATPQGCSMEHSLLMRLAVRKPQAFATQGLSSAKRDIASASSSRSAERKCAPSYTASQKVQASFARSDTEAVYLPLQSAGEGDPSSPVTTTRVETRSARVNKVEGAGQALPARSFRVPTIEIASPFSGSDLRALTPGRSSPCAGLSVRLLAGRS